MKEKNYQHGYRQALKDIKLAMDDITLGDWEAVIELFNTVSDKIEELSPGITGGTDEAPTQKYYLVVTSSKGNA